MRIAENVVWYADICDRHLAAQRSSGHQQVARLLAEKRDRARRLDDRTARLPRRAVKPTWNIHAQHRNAAGVDRFDQVRRVAIEGTRQAGAKQRVNDEIHALQSIGRGRPHVCVQAARHFPRIALELTSVSQPVNANLVTGGFKMAGRDVAVAAVVARPAQHRDPSWVRPHQARLARDRLASVLHQRERRHAKRDGAPVSLRHLLRRQKFVHVITFRAETLISGRAYFLGDLL